MKFNFQEKIPEIEKIIRYTFRDKSLLTQAFTRASYCNEHTRGEKIQSNEVLEFFGDSVLSLSIVSFLLKECTDRYSHGIRTELNEGDFSNIKSKLSDKTNLSRATRALGLQRYLLLGEGDEKLGVRDEASVMEDLFEAIVGAIYIDSDMSVAAVMHSVSGMLNILEYLNAAPPMQSAKNALQEWCAAKPRRLPSPVYKTVSESGPDHKKIFERGVYIGEELIATGRGKNQKQADSSAAEAALLRLMAREKDERCAKGGAKPNAPSPKKAEKSAPKPQQGKKAKTELTEKKRGAVKAKKASPTNASHEKRSVAIAKAAPVTVNNQTAADLIKEYALSLGRTPLSYRDLGGSDGFTVECRVGERSATGKGKTRAEARAAAAEILLSSVNEGRRRAKKGKRS